MNAASHAVVNRNSSVSPEYDAAISFLTRDIDTARVIADRLEADGLKVFFFPRNQETVAGTDGNESMRQPFLDARVVVVLYRNGWGGKGWTGIEEAAIEDRPHDDGWGFLMFVPMEKASSLPKWLPHHRVRFALPDYGIEQLLGAIKARIEKRGGTIKPLDARTKAQIVRRRRDYLVDRERLVRDANWTAGVHSSVEETRQSVIALADEISGDLGLGIASGRLGLDLILRTDHVSLKVRWVQDIRNCVIKQGDAECFLSVREYSGKLALQGESFIYIRGTPLPMTEHRFEVDVAEDRSLIWLESGANGRRISPDDLADRIVHLFLDLIARSDAGEVPRPYL